MILKILMNITILPWLENFHSFWFLGEPEYPEMD